MTRADQRRSFLISAVVHLVLMSVLATETRWNEVEAAPEVPSRPAAERVFLPPPEMLRQLAQVQPVPVRPAPTPTPPPPPPAKKDRMSVGAPALVRELGPVELRRDQDLTQVAKGRPDAIPREAPAAPEPTPSRRAAAQLEGRDTGGTLRLPGMGNDPSAGEAPTPPPASAESSVRHSLRNLDRLISEPGIVGQDSGTGRQMGPLHFDPRGADFTGWANQLRSEFFRNLIVPQSAWITRPGETRIGLEFDREGRLIDSRVLQSSGNEAFDRAMLNAFRSSRYYPLPEDYDLDTFKVVVTIQ